MKIQNPNTLICGVRRHEWEKEGKQNTLHFLDWYADEPHSSIIDEDQAKEFGPYKGQYVTAAFDITEYKGQVRYKVLAIRPQQGK